MFQSPDEFPLYKFYLDHGDPAAQHITETFNAAAGGDLEQQFKFAKGMYFGADAALPGYTPEMQKKTADAARAAFEEIAARKVRPVSADAAIYAAFCYIDEITGAPSDPGRVKQLIDDAEQIGIEGKAMRGLADRAKRNLAGQRNY